MMHNVAPAWGDELGMAHVVLGIIGPPATVAPRPPLTAVAAPHLRFPQAGVGLPAASDRDRFSLRSLPACPRLSPGQVSGSEEAKLFEGHLAALPPSRSGLGLRRGAGNCPQCTGPTKGPKCRRFLWALTQGSCLFCARHQTIRSTLQPTYLQHRLSL